MFQCHLISGPCMDSVPCSISENAVLAMHICNSVVVHSRLSNSYTLFCHMKKKHFLKIRSYCRCKKEGH